MKHPNQDACLRNTNLHLRWTESPNMAVIYKFWYWFGLLSLTALLCVFPAPGQTLARRLILKDGSYQPVIKYEVKGDRVRYLSAERGEWEELPNSLVDWPATEKYEKDRASGDVSPMAHEISEEEKAEREAEQAKAPEVSPGLRLPYGDGVFLLDSFKGQAQLMQLNQNGGEVDRDVKGNIIRATINPLAGSKQAIELKGEHAAVQSHVARPAIYVNFAGDQDSETATAVKPPAAADQKSDKNSAGPKSTAHADPANAPQYRLVRVKSKDGVRIVGNIKIAFYGKVSQQENFVASTAEPVSGGWVKVTPSANLAPGEYALVEMFDPKEMNLFVWDFGVNPAAPENPSAWKPQPVKAAAPEQDPTLGNRKK